MQKSIEKKRKGMFAGVLLFLLSIVVGLVSYFGANFLSPIIHIKFLELFIITFASLMSLIILLFGLGPIPLVITILGVIVKAKYFGGL